MSLFVRQALVRRQVDAERPWTVTAALVVASVIAFYLALKLLCFCLLMMLGGLMASASVLKGGIVAFFTVVTCLPLLVAPLFGLWAGKHWAWWLTAATAAGLSGLGLMAHFGVFPELLAAAQGWLSWLVGYPVPIALGSLVVLALLCSPPTRRWLLFCARVRSQMLA